MAQELSNWSVKIAELLSRIIWICLYGWDSVFQLSELMKQARNNAAPENSAQKPQTSKVHAILMA